MTNRIPGGRSLLQIAAGLTTVFCLGWCHTLAQDLSTPRSAALIFFLVIAICGGLALFARGLGGWLAAGLGAVTGLSTSIALVHSTTAPPANQLAFTAIAIGVLALLGYLSGCRSEPAGDAESQPSVASDAVAARRGSSAVRPDRRAAGMAFTADEVIGAVLEDFAEWSGNLRHDDADAVPSFGPAFDQFVRQTLREHLGARGVRVFRVVADGERLAPLTEGASRQTVAARTGIIGHVTTSGRVYVADDPHAGVLVEQLARLERQSAPGGESRWAWLLPLREARRTVALVAVARLEKRGLGGATMADALRDVLQLFWSHVQKIEILARCRCIDRSSGLLHRDALLPRLRAVAGSSTRAGEPLLVLALGIEGLRGLDDSGQWSLRDEVVTRLGRVLQETLRCDDVIGRFSDDRYVVTLRRVDSALGSMVANKVLQAVRRDVLDPLRGPGPAGRLRVRGGLAGSALGDADAELLLERAFALVQSARARGHELATDIDEADAVSEPNRPERAKGAFERDETRGVPADSHAENSARSGKSRLRPSGSVAEGRP